MQNCTRHVNHTLNIYPSDADSTLRHTLRTKMSLGFATRFKISVSIKSHPNCPIFMRSIKYPFCFDPFEFGFCSSLIGTCCSQREMRCFLELHMGRREVCIFPKLLRYTSGRKCSVSSRIKHSHKKCCGSEKNQSHLLREACRES